MSEAFQIRFAIFHHILSLIRKKTEKTESGIKKLFQQREDRLKSLEMTSLPVKLGKKGPNTDHITYDR